MDFLSLPSIASSEISSLGASQSARYRDRFGKGPGNNDLRGERVAFADQQVAGHSSPERKGILKRPKVAAEHGGGGDVEAAAPLSPSPPPGARKLVRRETTKDKLQKLYVDAEASSWERRRALDLQATTVIKEGDTVDLVVGVSGGGEGLTGGLLAAVHREFPDLAVASWMSWEGESQEDGQDHWRDLVGRASMGAILVLTPDSPHDPGWVLGLQALQSVPQGKWLVMDATLGDTALRTGGDLPEGLRLVLGAEKRVVTYIEQYARFDVREAVRQLRLLVAQKKPTSVFQRQRSDHRSRVSMTIEVSGNARKTKETQQRRVDDLLSGAPDHLKAFGVAYRLFLSHWRPSAHGPVGRIEGEMGADYRLFLNTKGATAGLQLHHLRQIVAASHMFALFMSEGVLSAVVCLEELRAAVELGKPIVLICDHRYRLPERRPRALEEDLMAVLQDLWPQRIMYHTEHLEPCTALLRRRLGVSDTSLARMNVDSVVELCFRSSTSPGVSAPVNIMDTPWFNSSGAEPEPAGTEGVAGAAGPGTPAEEYKVQYKAVVTAEFNRLVPPAHMRDLWLGGRDTGAARDDLVDEQQPGAGGRASLTELWKARYQERWESIRKKVKLPGAGQHGQVRGELSIPTALDWWAANGVEPQVSEEVLEALLAGVKGNDGLTMLSLPSNMLLPSAAALVASMLRPGWASAVQSLDLTDNGLGDEGCAAVMAAAAHCPSLLALELGHNGISDAGVRAVADCLRRSGGLVSLNLSQNQIHDEGARELLRALRSNGALRCLNLEANGIGEGLRGELAALFKAAGGGGVSGGGASPTPRGRVEEVRGPGRRECKVLLILDAADRLRLGWDAGAAKYILKYNRSMTMAAGGAAGRDMRTQLKKIRLSHLVGQFLDDASKSRINLHEALEFVEVKPPNPPLPPLPGRGTGVVSVDLPWKKRGKRGKAARQAEEERLVRDAHRQVDATVRRGREIALGKHKHLLRAGSSRPARGAGGGGDGAGPSASRSAGAGAGPLKRVGAGDLEIDLRLEEEDSRALDEIMSRAGDTRAMLRKAVGGGKAVELENVTDVVFVLAPSGSGDDVASSLLPLLRAKGSVKVVKGRGLADPLGGGPQREALLKFQERMTLLVNHATRGVVFLISEGAVADPMVRLMLQLVQGCKVRYMLVHPPDQCPFPQVGEMPEGCGVMLRRTVTFMSQYAEHVAATIHAQLWGRKGGGGGGGGAVMAFRVFFAGEVAGTAGELYSSLSNDYRSVLGADATGDNRYQLVHASHAVVVYLGPGVLERRARQEELEYAVDLKKHVVVVASTAFRELPSEVPGLAPRVLHRLRELWDERILHHPGHFEPCVERLRSLLGVSDASIMGLAGSAAHSGGALGEASAIEWLRETFSGAGGAGGGAGGGEESGSGGGADTGEEPHAQHVDFTSLSTPGIHVDMALCDVSEEAAHALAAGLRVNVSKIEINMRWCRLDAGGARALSDALPHLHHLQVLDVRFNSIGDDGATAIAGAIHGCYSLHTLVMSSNGIGHQGVRALCMWIRRHGARSLRRLELSSNPLQAQGSLELAEALGGCTSLAVLHVDGVGMDRRAASALLTGGSLALGSNLALRDLSMGYNPLLGPDVASKLAEAMLTNHSLAKLTLSSTGMGGEGVAKIGQAIGQGGALQELRLADNAYGVAGVRALCEMLAGSRSLQVLDLSSSSVGDADVPALAAALQRSGSLEHLCLQGCSLRDVSELMWAAGLSRSLSALDLGKNRVGVEGLQALADALAARSPPPPGQPARQQGLRRLVLRDNLLGRASGPALAQIVTEGAVLRELDLQGNELEDEGARPLLDAMYRRRHCPLESLNLARNQLGAPTADRLVDSLRHNTALRALDLRGNAMGVRDWEVDGRVLVHRIQYSCKGLQRLSMYKWIQWSIERQVQGR